MVVPAVPGFGFSAAPARADFGVDDVARMWATLMRELGYDRYATQGGDLGAYVAPAVARVLAQYRQIQQWTGSGLDHHALLRTAPQTFAYAGQDSPVALLAWQMQKLRELADRRWSGGSPRSRTPSPTGRRATPAGISWPCTSPRRRPLTSAPSSPRWAGSHDLISLAA